MQLFAFLANAAIVLAIPAMDYRRDAVATATTTTSSSTSTTTWTIARTMTRTVTEARSANAASGAMVAPPPQLEARQQKGTSKWRAALSRLGDAVNPGKAKAKEAEQKGDEARQCDQATGQQIAANHNGRRDWRDDVASAKSLASFLVPSARDTAPAAAAAGGSHGGQPDAGDGDDNNSNGCGGGSLPTPPPTPKPPLTPPPNSTLTGNAAYRPVAPRVNAVTEERQTFSGARFVAVALAAVAVGFSWLG
ncbi:hypothetical protein C8A03DRAFT_32024 [Achaetomium macrosporum]|uniref:Uncharacterized protein n=1 Tax=Achaetomium macrosporum TaxID=79813 RepID=A0AAN7CD90_9PEZI|nr:hypothetical protein C8A03DRAFT_32024 [Achaetomium macrosporum]